MISEQSGGLFVERNDAMEAVPEMGAITHLYAGFPDPDGNAIAFPKPPDA